MDHSMHASMGHQGHNMDPHEPMGPMCKMNMVFTWDWQDMCVVFRWWHVQTFGGLLLSLIAIVALGAGYEYVKREAEKYDYRCRMRSQGEVSTANANAPNENIIKSLIYAFQVAYSFMLMLVFMTYNGWAMIAVTVGAFIGHYLFGQAAAKSMSCH